MFRCDVVADTIHNGNRITTLELCYPRFIHAEIMTHRDRARNAGSSRAIPWTTMRKQIEYSPVVPIKFGANQKGMTTGEEVNREEAIAIWLRAKQQALRAAQDLADLGVHKSICNRLTEPFMWITVVMTATCWRNFFNQRCSPDAEIHMQEIASLMRTVIKGSTPHERGSHLPYVEADDIYQVETNPHPFDSTITQLMKISTARCARVAYTKHGATMKDLADDLRLFDDTLHAKGHWSPFEHPGIPCSGRSGPYIGWKSFRKFFQDECPQEGYP